ncbi:MAG: fused MFS/spermidine synthase [Armatimonadetes bacterium]|nr:fused MFS/spermidine synthase [Armatimonadota bacterium]
MGIPARRVAALLYGSGMCALIYQVVWLREFRLVFGASTAASAAVLAIFMGGLGVGGAVLGRRADRHPRPLAFYAGLELLIAGSAAATPFLVQGVGSLYHLLGGSPALGPAPAALARLALSVLVLGAPTFLMGGTLPAAARAVETDEDAGRRRLALLYGANTLGAVTGALLTTFFLLGIFGARQSLWIGCLCNALVAVLARALARSDTAKPSEAVSRPAAPAEETPADAGPTPAPAGYVLAAAAATGFAFFLMEMVWYRMLGPLLGGSTFTFGLILAVVLLGIGLGGVAWALAGRGASPTPGLFALTLGIEALCIAIPFALGDRLAVLAAQLRALGSFGFAGDVAGWGVVAGLTTFPAAFVAGIQFPLLLGLLGRGRRDVGRQTGLAYAWNTAGAIAGSLAGGFGLLPLLSAPGTWRAVVALLALMAVGALVLSVRREGWPRTAGAAAGAIGLALLLLAADGPTAAWRHSPIGAGRVDLFQSTRNDVRRWAHEARRGVTWEAEGVESSVAVDTGTGLSFVINGKVDGHVQTDAPTQVMLGLVGAALHPRPRRSLVVGLGTGCSAGWLAHVAGMDRVDVVEMEPAILEVARRCAPVNRDPLANPKVRVVIGDAREVLLTSPERYDLIASEPSNPYRAGVASLYTREFYRGVASRLTEGGLFLQWIQAYEVDTETVRTIYATLASVFPVVTTWQTNPADLLLVCSRAPVAYPVPLLRERLRQEPFRSALALSWRAAGLEGFLAHHAARPEFAKVAAAPGEGSLSTDDRMTVEYGFARTVGRRQAFTIADLRGAARAMGLHRPVLTGGSVDWMRVEAAYALMFALDESNLPRLEELPAEQRACGAVVADFRRERHATVTAAWHRGVLPPESPAARSAAAWSLAAAGDAGAPEVIRRLRADSPAEADLALAQLHARRGEMTAAAAALVAAFERARTDPWVPQLLLSRSLRLAAALGEGDHSLAPPLYQAVRRPFVVRLVDEERMRAALTIAAVIGGDALVEALAAFEPYPLWETKPLILRARCYRDARHPKARLAEAELSAYLRNATVKLSELLIHDPREAGRASP